MMICQIGEWFKMKIVYITHDNNVTTTKNGYTGVIKKVISQISELRTLGMESELQSARVPSIKILTIDGNTEFAR